MSVQDRNIHRDAQALRKSVAVELIVPTFGVDQDQPIYHTVPRYNWRLSDLNCWIHDLQDAVLTVSAQAVPVGAVVGSPIITPSGSPDQTIGTHHQFEADGITMIRRIPQVVAYTNPFTILDGFWGVILFVIDETGTITTIAQAPIMAFATEKIALANCPKVPPIALPNTFGRVLIQTINADGGDFIGGTTNTNAALVAAFNVAPQAGHVCSCPISSSDTSKQTPAVLGQQLKDASGTNILQGKGGVGGDALVVMTKCFGGTSIIGLKGQAVVEYRPWPSAGEGLGDTSVSQNRPSFVP